MPVEELRKLPPRGGAFPPLAFVNAVFEPRQGHVNVRLCGGHRVTLVQRRPLEAAPAGEAEEAARNEAGAWRQLWRQLCSGELGFWHAATLRSEEAHAEEDQRLRGDEPPLTFCPSASCSCTARGAWPSRRRRGTLCDKVRR